MTSMVPALAPNPPLVLVAAAEPDRANRAGHAAEAVTSDEADPAEEVGQADEVLGHAEDIQPPRTIPST
jgi:hypothetical protein